MLLCCALRSDIADRDLPLWLLNDGVLVISHHLEGSLGEWSSTLVLLDRDVIEFVVVIERLDGADNGGCTGTECLIHASLLNCLDHLLDFEVADRHFELAEVSHDIY